MRRRALRSLLPGRAVTLKVRDVRGLMPRLSEIPAAYPPKQILGAIIHHSASVTPSTGRPVGNARSFFRYFVQDLKWDHGGYHYVILPDGVIEYALDEREHAYQAGFSDQGEDEKWENGQYWNHHYLAVCMVGWFDRDREHRDGTGRTTKIPDRHTRPSRAQYRALILLLRALQDRYRFPAGQILGHRECYGQDTVCPGMQVDLERLRSAVSRSAGKIPPSIQLIQGPGAQPADPGLAQGTIPLLGGLKRFVNSILRLGGKLAIAATLPLTIFLWLQPPSLASVLPGIVLALASTFLAVLLSLRWIDPPTTAFILSDQRRQGRLRPFFRSGRVWVPLGSISPSMRLAVVAAEDLRFLEHTGFDWYGIYLAWIANRSGEPLRGYSTISQQLVKNLFLWPAQTYTRKAIEAVITILLENLWSKERILEVYLNVVQFGEQLYGIQAASEHHFHTSPDLLTDDQARFLAAILPNPLGVQAERPSKRIRSRMEQIGSRMKAHPAQHAPIFTKRS